MSIASKKAVRNIVLSLALLLGPVVISIATADRSLIGVAIAFAIILGLPCLLLSIADLGRALRVEHGGNQRATTATNLLSHYRAAGGAICISVAGYTVIYNVRALVDGAASAPIALQLLWIALGISMVVLGSLLIFRAFVKDSSGVE